MPELEHLGQKTKDPEDIVIHWAKGWELKTKNIWETSLLSISNKSETKTKLTDNMTSFNADTVISELLRSNAFTKLIVLFQAKKKDNKKQTIYYPEGL